MYNNCQLVTKVGMFKHFPLSLFWMVRAKSIILDRMQAKASTVLNSPSWTSLCSTYVCFHPQKVMVWLMYVMTFCFCLTWQFNQFILLVQALVIYTLDCVDLLTTTQVWLHSKKKKTPKRLTLRVFRNKFISMPHWLKLNQIQSNS